MENKYNTEFFNSFKSFENIFDYALNLITDKKIKEAKNFYEAYIQYLYDVNPRDIVTSLEHARECAGKNFGYWAGYYGDDVRKLVKEYFNAIHPYFGDRYNISAEEAFNIGYNLGLTSKNNKMKKLKELFDKLMMWMFFSDLQPTVDKITDTISNETKKLQDKANKAKSEEAINKLDEQKPIGFQITDYNGKSQVYSQRHVFKTFLDAMDFADNNNFLFGFEVRPVYAKDITNPVYIDSSLCR